MDKILGKLLAWAQIALLVYCTMFVAGTFDRSGGIPYLMIFYWSGLLVFMGRFCLVIIHEAGHALLGWLGGWRIAVVAVGPVTIWPDQRRIRLGSPAFPGAAGAIISIPPEGMAWRASYILMLAGGPGANLIFGAALMIAVKTLSPNVFWSHYLMAMAELSMFLFAANLVPIKIGQYKFDGKQLAMALQGKNLEPWANFVRLSADIIAPKRPRDWDARLVEAVIQDCAAGLGDGGAGMALCQYYLDRDDVDMARKSLEWAAERLGEIDAIKLMRAIILAYFDEDAEAAAALLGTLKRRGRKSAGYLVAQAIITRRTGDADFPATLHRARAALKRAPFSTAADFEFMDILAEPPHHELHGELAAAAP